MKPNGAIIYEGPSELDGRNIVVIATGLTGRSRNVKTGHVVQTWILLRDINPISATQNGADSTICGACPHRGRMTRDAFGRPVNSGRSCYVRVDQAPLSVWRSYHRGIYPRVSAADLSALLAGKTLRLGSYGDPAAVPLYVWASATQNTAAHVGYTHQWSTTAPELARYCMASIDRACDAIAAEILGYRTFRVRHETESLAPKEVTCPASKEAGHKSTCGDCRACGGTAAKARVNIAIIAHGGRRSNFAANVVN